MLPANAAGRHGRRIGRIGKTTIGALKVGQEAFGNEGYRCGLGAVLVLEEGFIGKLRELVVVLGIPDSLGGFEVNAGVSTVLHHLGVDDHRSPGDRFTIGEVDGAVDQILEVVAVSNFDVNFRTAVSERGDVGGGKGREKHQQHQENWLCFRVRLI